MEAAFKECKVSEQWKETPRLLCLLRKKEGKRRKVVAYIRGVRGRVEAPMRAWGERAGRGEREKERGKLAGEERNRVGLNLRDCFKLHAASS